MSNKIYPYKTIDICLNEEGDGFVNNCNLEDIISKLKYMGISQEEYKNVRISSYDEYCFAIRYTREKIQEEINVEIEEKENKKNKKQQEKEIAKQEREKRKQEKEKVLASLTEEQKLVLGYKSK